MRVSTGHRGVHSTIGAPGKTALCVAVLFSTDFGGGSKTSSFESFQPQMADESALAQQLLGRHNIDADSVSLKRSDRVR